MTIVAPKEIAVPMEASRPHRCLILANAKAGQILSLFDRCSDFGQTLWRRFLNPSAPIECDEEQKCVPIPARTASASGRDAHVEETPPPHQIPERIRAAEVQGYDSIV